MDVAIRRWWYRGWLGKTAAWLLGALIIVFAVLVLVDNWGWFSPTHRRDICIQQQMKAGYPADDAAASCR